MAINDTTKNTNNDSAKRILQIFKNEARLEQDRQDSERKYSSVNSVRSTALYIPTTSPPGFCFDCLVLELTLVRNTNSITVPFFGILFIFRKKYGKCYNDRSKHFQMRKACLFLFFPETGVASTLHKVCCGKRLHGNIMCRSTTFNKDEWRTETS